MKYILFLFMFGICGAVNAQHTDSLHTQTDSLLTQKKIYDFLDQMPEFPGGFKALFDFMYANLQYPSEAIKKEIEGIVYVKFIVDEYGNISNPVVVRSIGGGCDEEAVRIINLMPQWNPGAENGKPAAVWYTLPVKFTIVDTFEENSNKKKKKN
ncbi:MAG: energy transducer TonB [Bacteroidetes bacterium]|nr:energy transducer TonB [Bacteroidota bacterium]